jgi:hypothetical protein
MKECVARIEAIHPTDKRPSHEKFVYDDMTLELVDVIFRLEDAAEELTEVVFKEPHKVLGVSADTERLGRKESPRTPYHLQHGTHRLPKQRRQSQAVLLD